MDNKTNQKQTIWELAQEKGYNRRDFLKFCGWIGAAAGIASTQLGRVVYALENNPRPPLIWLHFQECTCCSESFIKSDHPLVADVVLDLVSLDYTETLQAASGHQAETAMKQTMEKYKGEYILLVEGSIPTKDDGIHCCIGGRSALQILEEAAKDAKAIIAWGNCAFAGCVQAAKPNPTGATPVRKLVHGKPIINVPGCPPIADVMAGVVVHLLTFGRIPELDAQGRPKAFYGRRIHDTCYRRANYDAGLFVETFDDANAKKGYCLYKMGCRGPVTYNACAVTKWNGGVSFPIQSGHGCIGCSEADFWDQGPLYQHLPETAGFGIEATADKIGAAAAVATVAGVAAHFVTANLTKHGEIQDRVKGSKE
ncbi:MAG: hydrogenase [Candidatus Lambdaproteobacteria bacterium RIFOXYD1_FULL_56_27]|uniref:hydrogenase (acceptor) n=1 Tax=Candidatus Lambdaproteobacteria bacterium RIFOXYD2_FULL_56_26 TaxID=1817773 RepID=A0A1F6GVB2_9PROT|nr:MAG: hydrogenase [Candidatus Lambdaproteobacteria bacterium RIFOXYC1_FULL_56_13]OGH02064.1 MAG: hydrogenase [Candidatus Lambdaproteobacteria bacterium RIFOXYD2_FULL_56_26]OGH07714.1 MAG: hydrogenase [Candidatus Lambdaproteobacteria bacterium RIFOXYD1_FULL_56_27]